MLADIGDSQDLQQSLSTFSGHIRRVDGILRAAGPATLVLLDEVGSAGFRGTSKKMSHGQAALSLGRGGMICAQQSRQAVEAHSGRAASCGLLAPGAAGRGEVCQLWQDI